VDEHRDTRVDLLDGLQQFHRFQTGDWQFREHNVRPVAPKAVDCIAHGVGYANRELLKAF
jgi:hypothetical protein